MSDQTQKLQAQVASAVSEKRSLNIIGGNSKAFYGRTSKCESLHLQAHSGIVSYEPTELVMTVRAGTPLEEIEDALSKNNQMLPFEPPHYGSGATIGGTIACNLSGPRRAYSGAARDYVLGTKIINGKAEVLRFGGEVMKNVAGYDASRLMTGAMGTLGVLLEVSFKVLPRFASEITLVQEINADDAISKMNQWAGMPNPISATAYLNG
ncbi:MAG: glycolate oxidase subunit GlcE, partial [Gammaproteobacteria bacterium]|nr:glycolate oxidase subunit GlcE [Gammaproteobacteria bacterium]